MIDFILAMFLVVTAIVTREGYRKFGQDLLDEYSKRNKPVTRGVGLWEQLTPENSEKVFKAWKERTGRVEFYTERQLANLDPWEHGFIDKIEGEFRKKDFIAGLDEAEIIEETKNNNTIKLIENGTTTSNH